RRKLCGRGGGVSEWMEMEKKVCRGGIIWGEERERGEEEAGAICGSEGAYGLVRNYGGVCEPFTSMDSDIIIGETQRTYDLAIFSNSPN
ncbi:hypothetical protein HOY82DRAFT_564151, partial [Tuber indicum]